MKRAGFTMIELIFVIVILGILAAVAIPKLAATREDATASATLASFKTAINQIQADTIAQGVINPDFRTIVDGSASLTVAASAVTATDGTTTCASATETGNNLVIDVQTQTGICILFADMVDHNVSLLGSAISR